MPTSCSFSESSESSVSVDESTRCPSSAVLEPVTDLIAAETIFAAKSGGGGGDLCSVWLKSYFDLEDLPTELTV